MGKLNGTAGTELLRPQTDSTKVGILYSTGTNMSALIDDSPDDDTTYVRGTIGKTWPDVWAITSVTDLASALGANQRISKVRMRARVRMNASDPGHGAAIDCKFRSAITGKMNGYTRFYTTNPSTFQAQTGPWVFKDPNGIEWSYGRVRDITIYYVFYDSAGSVHEHLRLSEFYMDVDIRNQPVVDTVTVAGNDTSTRPTVSWNYTPNVDNDTQKWYRVKIFDSNQYGAVGFNPETSKAIWDSGEVAGEVTSYTIGTDLVVGSTYKAYVKAAQSFNVTDHWYSAWASTPGTFTITPPVPPVPTLTLTADPTVPYLRNLLNAVSNLNLLTFQQASLEDGTTTGWEAVSNCTIASEGTIAADGTKSLKITNNTGVSPSIARTLSGTSGVRVQGGQSITGLFFVRTAVTAKSVLARLYWWKKDGTAASTASSDGTGSNDTTSFVVRTVTATAPADAWYCSLAAVITTAVNGEIHYVDKADIHYGAGTTWSEGGFVGNTSTVIERAIVTADNKNLAHPQLYSGGDFRKSADGFYTTGTYSTVQYDPSDQFFGSGAILWRVDDTTSALYIGWGSLAITNLDPDFPLAVVPGRVFSFGVALRASQSFASTLAIEAIDRDGNIVGSATTSGITITTSWVEYKIENWTVPASAVWARVHVDNSGGVVDRLVWADRVRWYLGTTLPATVDKATSGQDTVWQAVRGADEGNLLATTLAGTLYAEDMEVPPGCVVIYRARNFQPATDTLPDISSSPTAYIPTMMDAVNKYVLSVPGDPIRRMEILVQAMPQKKHEEAETFYTLRPDGTIPTVVLSDGIGGADGELSLIVKTDDDWDELYELLSQQKTLWLVNQDVGGRYIRINDERSWTPSRIQRGTAWLRRVTVPFVEVAN